MWETYTWECWHDKPKMEKINCNWEVKCNFRWKILALFLMIGLYFLQILIQIGYFLTLPFAIINEFLRG